MFYYYVVRLFSSCSVFQHQGLVVFFFINKKDLQNILLCVVCFCWQ